MARDERVSDGRSCTDIETQHDLGLLHRLNRPFAGTVTINPRETALQIASSEHLRTEANRLVLWTDASVRSSFYNDSPYAAGISIVWRPSHTPHDWKNQTYGLRGHFTTGEAEFFAIAEAMRLAVEMVRDRTKRSGHNQPDQVVIYTDSQTSLVWISRYHHFSLSARYRVARQRELAILKQRARALTKMGVNLELRYVPGHANVEGNVMADFFAKRASGSAAGYVVSEQYEQLEPAVDGYLGSRPPLASLARSQRVLHQRRLGKREAAPILNMRFRSSTRATNVGSSLSPTNRATSARMILSQRPLRPGKNMKKYRALMQSQLKKTVLPKTQPVPQRIPSLKIQDLRRTITIDGVTKQIMKRPPPPPPPVLPRPSSHAVEEARG